MGSKINNSLFQSNYTTNKGLQEPVEVFKLLSPVRPLSSLTIMATGLAFQPGQRQLNATLECLFVLDYPMVGDSGKTDARKRPRKVQKPSDKILGAPMHARQRCFVQCERYRLRSSVDLIIIIAPLLIDSMSDLFAY